LDLPIIAEGVTWFLRPKLLQQLHPHHLSFSFFFLSRFPASSVDSASRLKNSSAAAADEMR
jgi:hypothetical protein